MKKINILILFFMLMKSIQNSFAYDMQDGVWKNLNEKYAQTTNNKSLVSGMIFSRIDYNDTFASNNKNNRKGADLRSRFGVNLKLSNNFSLKTVAIFENISNATSNIDGKNRFFRSEGLFLNELVLGYDYKNFSAVAGKFNPNFGDAWKPSNGIWTREISGEYEQREKLGFGLIQRAGNIKTIGEYIFGASVFTNDRKNLDNSIITSRDSVAKSDGAAGDTRGLDSYVLSTDIYYDFGNNEKLSYHFSYLNLAINNRQNHSNIPAYIDDEKGLSLGMNYRYPINDDFLFDSFVEYVNIDNIGGDIAKNSDFLTINFTAHIFKDYFITLTKAQEKQKKTGENGIDKSFSGLSFGYKLDHLNPNLKNLRALIGYKNSDLDSKTNFIQNKSFSVIITHKLEF